ncbi:MAG: hypothetical protein JNK04_10435 [Myxococcales bacterium]|nr:hypothetical protein [Myxococcales bacterium]
MSSEDVLRQREARFSPQETRARRLGDRCAATPESGICCYVHFTATKCR